MTCTRVGKCQSTVRPSAATTEAKEETEKRWLREAQKGEKHKYKNREQTGAVVVRSTQSATQIVIWGDPWLVVAFICPCSGIKNGYSSVQF